MGNAPRGAAPGADVTIADIERAASVLEGAVLDTDFDRSRTLSDMLGCELWLKFENLQFTASFKERGALNRLAALAPHQRGAGIIAMSAGNHAQGVAYHARRLGIAATIVMPLGTPFVKIENTKRHGAEVIVTGATLEEAAEYAREYEQRHGLTFIHPYDDPLIIAGQGTVALEMLKAVPQLDTMVVPIGGGGLISGVAVAAKAVKPAIEIIGVQAELYPSMYNRIRGTQLPMRGDTLAEGIAVKAPGVITERLVRAYVDDIVLVSEAEIERAVALLIRRAGQGREPDRPVRGQHHRGRPPARVHRPAGQEHRAPGCHRDARPRAPQRDGGQDPRRRLPDRNHFQ
jgi:threonine dehydratase